MGLFSSPEKEERKRKKNEIDKKYNLDVDRLLTICKSGGQMIRLDIVTGVNYLYIYVSSPEGITNTITPLLGTDGKPVIYTKEQIDEIVSSRT